METHEFELITGEKLRHIKVFVNEIAYRNYHFHNAFELLLVLEGTGRVRLVGETIRISPGTLVLINPNEPHEIEAEGGVLTAGIMQVSRGFCGEYLPDLRHTRFLRRDLNRALSDRPETLERLLRGSAGSPCPTCGKDRTLPTTASPARSGCFMS